MTDEEVQQLVKNYRPNAEVLMAMANINMLAIVGPSASGKTTVIRALTKAHPEFGVVLDETSRAPRKDEEQGVDMLFRGRDEIIDDARKGRLIQVAIGPNGDFYSTRISSYPAERISTLPLVPAAVEEFRKLPVGSFKSAFMVPATFELWQDWLRKQAADSDWTEEQKQGRLKEAKFSYEFALADTEMHFVLNEETTARAVSRLVQVSRGQTPAEESEAKTAAQANYAKLLEILNR
jgi:guanylate kinase